MFCFFRTFAKRNIHSEIAHATDPSANLLAPARPQPQEQPVVLPLPPLPLPANFQSAPPVSTSSSSNGVSSYVYFVEAVACERAHLSLRDFVVNT